MTPPAPGTPARVRPSHVDWLEARLSVRDLAVVATVNRLRVVTGQQLERLCFAELRAGRSRTVTRSRVLARLVAWRALVSVGRRVGGDGRGSTAAAFALDSGGQQILLRQHLATAERTRVRRPGKPGERSLRHSLAVAELYVELVEQGRRGLGRLASFETEPAAWWPTGTGGTLKPDAYAVLERPGARDHWWLEVDLATESLPTVRDKVAAYLAFRQSGGRGPSGIVPWVLVSTVTAARRDAITQAVRHLPEVTEVVRVAHHREAASLMFEALNQ